MTTNFDPRLRGAATIVIVEDDDDILELLRELFEDEGWRVRTCANGSDALPTVEQARADFVLLDLVLPGLDGVGVLREIRRSPLVARVPVIVMTAAHPEPIPEADAIVLKPFSADALLRLVDHVRGRPLPRDMSAARCF